MQNPFEKFNQDNKALTKDFKSSKYLEFMTRKINWIEATPAALPSKHCQDLNLEKQHQISLINYHLQRLEWPSMQMSALHHHVSAGCIDPVLRATARLGVNSFPPSLCDSYLLTFRYSHGYHQQEIGLWSLKRTLADKLTTRSQNQAHRHELFGWRCFQLWDLAVFVIFYYRSVWGTDRFILKKFY